MIPEISKNTLQINKKEKLENFRPHICPAYIDFSLHRVLQSGREGL